MNVKVVDASAIAALLFGEPEATTWTAHQWVARCPCAAALRGCQHRVEEELARKLNAELITLDSRLAMVASASNEPF